MSRKVWARNQLLVAFRLYCQMPFGQFHSKNKEIIKYAELIGRSPSALAMKLGNIASLDPVITGTGRKGLAGASSADREMWAEMQNDWNRFSIESEAATQTILQFAETADPDSSEVSEDQNHYGEDKVVQSKIRIGQSFFRRSVLSAYNDKCCISGLAVPELLVASHIIPWSKDESNRLNPSNGLALSAIHDKAFDQGIITITSEFTVQVSKRKFIDSDEFYAASLISFDGKPIVFPDKFSPNSEFLKYHRENVFEK